MAKTRTAPQHIPNRSMTTLRFTKSSNVGQYTPIAPFSIRAAEAMSRPPEPCRGAAPSPLLITMSFALDFRWLHVLAETHITGMPQVAIWRPFDELDPSAGHPAITSGRLLAVG